MFACILLILFLPAALLPFTLNMLFSACELNTMGIHLDDMEDPQIPADETPPCAILSLCI